ncbi:MAG: MBL fold metallo-hydrolase [Phycisphaeraceae bacterium]
MTDTATVVPRVPPGVHRVGFGHVFVHLLVDETGVVLIDTGMIGEVNLIHRKLRALGFDWKDVRAILLTHGHLDHAGRAHVIRRLTEAPIYAHPEEQPHIDGCYPYTGISRVCGILEACGRFLFRYRSVPIDVPLHDGQHLDLWGGLEVMHLPGHSIGHCGFYSAKHDVLFSGDLFEDWFGWTRASPPWFNSCPQFFPESFRRVAELDPTYILPNHYIQNDGRAVARRFHRYYERRWKQQA